MMNNLKGWREKLPSLPNPKERPNDFQRLVLQSVKNGMTIRDAVRVFGISQPTINKWANKFSDSYTEPDGVYFMRRARELGASDEVIAVWFGFDRVDKVSMLLAEVSSDD